MNVFRENALKKRLAKGHATLGCWLDMTSPMAAEIVGLAGYDFVIIDHEHGPGTLADARALLQALSGAPATTILRVPANDPVYVKRALDLGVEGLMFPSINTAEDARAAVSACHYPPRGVRGAAYGMIRGADYGLCGEHYRDACGDELLVICQIETAAAVEAIPQIAATPGVEALFVGPYDLSGSIGKLGRFDDAEVAALLDRAERAILDSGVIYGTIPTKNRSLEDLIARGARLIAAGSDIGFVRTGAVQQVTAFRAAVQGRNG